MTKLKTIFCFLTICFANIILFAQPCTLSINGNSSIALCQNQFTSLNGTTANGTLDSIIWNTSPPSTPVTGNSYTIPTSTTGTRLYVATAYFQGGCSARDTVTVTINAVPNTPVFSFSPNTIQCSGTPISFSVTNPQVGVTYSWNFGDGGTATGTSASHTYNSIGNGTTPYNATLTATNGLGCSTTSTNSTIQVKQQPDAVLVDLVNDPQFVNCNGGSFALSVADNGTNTYSNYVIDWGDGSADYSSTTPPPISPSVDHTYSTLGYNTITYTVTNSNNCSTTRLYSVFNGGNPQVGMANPGGTTGLCTPATLSFPINNVSNNPPGTIYIITTNDGSLPDTLQHPPPTNYVHQFFNTSCGNASPGYPNSFYIRIEAVNPCASSAATVEPITTNELPDADFSISPDTTACINTTVTFTNTSTGGAFINAQNQCDTTKIINWIITPNSGFTVLSGSREGNNPPSVNLQSTWGTNSLNVQFTTAGTYRVKLIVRAKNVCGHDTITKTVCIQSPPTPAFTATPRTGCAPLVVNFANTSTGINQCDSISRLWTITPINPTCAQDSLANFVFISGTNATSVNPVIRFNNSGTYTVKLTLTNACGTFDSQLDTIIVKRKPQATASTAPAAICTGQSITPSSTANACAGTISTYAWSFPSGNPASSNIPNPTPITYSTAGNFTVSLSVTNECGTTTATAPISVQNAPTANAGADQNYCSGDSLQIGAITVAGNTYSWSPATGLSSTTISNPTVTLTASGTTTVTQTYIVTVTNTAGCSKSDTTVVTVFPPATVNAGPSVTLCNTNSATLAGTFGGSTTSVTWTSNNGGTFSNVNSLTPTYTPTISSGTVLLTATTNDPTGTCPAVNDTMTITVVQPPIANAGVDSAFCSGSNISIGAPSQPGYAYNWSPATELSSSTVANPIVTLTNNGGIPISQTYTLITSATGCSDTDQVVISIYPPATVNAGTVPNICYGDSVQLNGSISGAATSATWTSSNGTFTNTTNLNTFFHPTITSGTATITLTSNDPVGPCPVATSNTSATINSIPVIAPTPDQTVCGNVATNAIAFTSSVGGTTFAWSGTSTSGITGFPTNGTSSSIASFNPNNPSDTVGTITYIVTPTANGCAGIPDTFNIAVKPQPNIAPIPPQIVCSNQPTTSVLFTSTLANTTYNWSSSPVSNVTGNTPSGLDSIPSQTLINSGTTNGTATYTVTPTANGCTGTPTNFSVTVYPIPTINTIAPQNICSGAQTTTVSLTSPVAGTTYAWTSTATTGVNGNMLSGNGIIPIQTMTYTGTTQGTATYTITPTANGCIGTPHSFTDTIFPIPTVIATPSIDTVCSGTATNIALLSNVATTTFSWTVSAPSLVTGASAGIGSSITQTLTNTNTTPQTVTYTITPSANNCTGTPVVISILVNPQIAVNFSPNHQNICSEDTSVLVNISSPTSGVSFTWTSQANGIGGVATNGTNTIPAQTLSNLTNAPINVVYSITANYAGCITQNFYDTITVNPIPVATANPSAQTLCEGAPTSVINLSSSVAGGAFLWTGGTTDGITAFTVSGSTNTIPSQTLNNPNNTVGSVIYSITPTANGCSGLPIKDTITIKPIPNIILPTSQTICSGDTNSTVTISSSVMGTTYTWTSTATAGISGNNTNGSGNIPPQTFTNSGTTSGTVTYTITANASSCLANSPYTVTVNPQPIVAFSIPPQTICSNNSTAQVDLTSSTSGVNISWTANVPIGITGAATSGTTNIPSQILINSTFQPLTVTYTAQATTTGVSCAGTNNTYTITVNPAPNLSATPLSDTICSTAQTNILLNSTVSGASFSWTVNNPPNISGQSAGTGNNITQTLTNTGTSPQIVIYTISTNAASCPGQTVSANVTIYPSPVIQFSIPNQTICSGFTTQNVQITSSTPNAVISWTATIPSSITGATTSGTTTIPIQTHSNSSNTPQQVLYNVSATYGSCQGGTNTYTITVNPTPHVINTDTLQSVCSNNLSTPIALTSDVTNTTFTWNGTGSANLSGYQTSGSSDTIPAQSISNASTISDTVLFIVTPISAGCVGVPQKFQIAVKPLPVVSLTPDTQIICTTSSSAPIVLSSTIAATTYAWTSSSIFASGATVSGIGTPIPAQTLQNTSPQADTGFVIYTVVPMTDGCPGQSVDAVIQINPKPVVDFTMNTNTGCSPLDVSFATNTLTFGSPDSLIFNWGDGTTNTVLRPNPIQPIWSTSSHTFVNTTVNAITYTITLTAMNACGDTTVSHTIVVQPNTVNAFFTPSAVIGCEPLSVSFGDFSTGATFSSWCFDYDIVNNTCVGTSSVATPGTTVQHTYNAGTYTAALFITNGCSRDTAYQTIQVEASPIVNFTHDNNVCKDASVTFTQQSIAPSGSFLTAFDWQFGDGDSLLGNTVSHTYDSATTYNACLKVTASNGCANTQCRPIVVISKPVADFTVSDTCVNTPPSQFTNTSVGATFYQWNFGDGNTSVLQNPVNNYLSSGTYSVTLISSSNTCSDTVTHSISIYPKPTADFIIPATYSCGIPSTVSLTNTSSGALGYAWNFGNGTFSTAVNPTTTYNNTGTFTVSLIASNQFNCFDSVQRSIDVYTNPTIQSIDILNAEGCLPQTIEITANTTNGNTYVWDFGDGTSPVSLNTATGTHNYTDTGVYTISVWVYSTVGCSDTAVLTDTVHVHISPIADFNFETNTTVEPIDGSVIFTNTSQHANHYVWDFGDGFTSTAENPTYRFSDVNTFNVTLYAYNDYCEDSISKSVTVFKRSLWVPNAMQPGFIGGNNLVQIWQPIGIGIDANNYKAQVFNTWGELLWQSTKIVDTKPAEGWDGTYKGVPCPQDVYVWKIYAKFLDNTEWDGMDYGHGKKTIGDITLIR